MIIVSQDKDTITNLNNVDILGIGDSLEDSEGKFKILANTVSDNQYVIAKYDTEERAKEVLQEIIECYKDTNYEYENCWCLRNLTYEMPEK